MSASPSLDTLLGTITTLTGHHVAFHPTPGRPPGIAHSFHADVTAESLLDRAAQAVNGARRAS